MKSDKQEKYYLGVFYKHKFLAFLGDNRKFFNLERDEPICRWTNDLENAEVFMMYLWEKNEVNPRHITEMNYFYNRTTAGTSDLLNDDHDKKNGRLVAFLRPNFHNICTDQLSFKYLSKNDIRLLKLKELL